MGNAQVAYDGLRLRIIAKSQPDVLLGWVDQNNRLWLFGGVGYDASGTYGSLNSLWLFDPSQGADLERPVNDRFGCLFSRMAVDLR